MSSLRHITLPGAIILLATLLLRLPATEAEWLAVSLLHLRGRMGAVLGPFGPRRIIHPCGF
jgi:hypothetical protein